MYYQDATGFPVAGFMRCCRVIRREKRVSLKTDDDNSDSSESPSKSPKSVKRKKLLDGESASSSVSSEKNSTIDQNSDVGSSNKQSFDTLEEEFVCVIRPASTSTPHHLNNLHLLSAASMVAHDSQQGPPSEKRRGSGRSPSDGSNSSSGLPISSCSTEQTKNSTSSEDRSEDNSGGSEDNNAL